MADVTHGWFSLEFERHRGRAGCLGLSLLCWFFSWRSRGQRPRYSLSPYGPTAVQGLMSYRDFITIEEGKRGGRPCIRGLRITVGDVLGWLAAGLSHEQIIADYPELTEDDIRACLAYAADRASNALKPPPKSHQ
jgi:uncharacterized protein (DUF433 family)